MTHVSIHRCAAGILAIAAVIALALSTTTGAGVSQDV